MQGNTQIPRLNLDELYTFVVLAQLRSFSAAADVLHRTTSAVSHRLKMLEDSLGVILVERNKRFFKLTPEGEMLREKAEQIIELQCRIPEELQQVREGIEPSFTIVINNLLYDAAAAARLLHHLHTLFAHTAFKIGTAVYMGVWDALVNGHSQFGIGVPGFHAISDNFHTEQLGSIPWVMVAAPHHPLAQQQEHVSIELLRQYPVVNIEDTSVRLQKRLPWRLAGQQELIVPDLETKIQCHMQGLGIGFLPESLAHPLMEQGHLVQIKLAGQYRNPSPLAVAWPKKAEGKISLYLHTLLQQKHELLQPFMQCISVQPQNTEAQPEG